MSHIYILKLEDKKYYVGRTQNLDERIDKHFKEESKCLWTKLHKPISLVETFSNCTNFDEDKYTKIYMNRFGIDNVRGGSYTQIFLEPLVKEILEKEFRSANNQCFNCGEKGHYVKNCNIPSYCLPINYGKNNLKWLLNQKFNQIKHSKKIDEFLVDMTEKFSIQEIETVVNEMTKENPLDEDFNFHLKIFLEDKTILEKEDKNKSDFIYEKNRLNNSNFVPGWKDAEIIKSFKFQTQDLTLYVLCNENYEKDTNWDKKINSTIFSFKIPFLLYFDVECKDDFEIEKNLYKLTFCEEFSYLQSKSNNFEENKSGMINQRFNNKQSEKSETIKIIKELYPNFRPVIGIKISENDIQNLYFKVHYSEFSRIQKQKQLLLEIEKKLIHLLVSNFE